MGRGDSRPVEDLFGEPMILRRVASARPRDPPAFCRRQPFRQAAKRGRPRMRQMNMSQKSAREDALSHARRIIGSPNRSSTGRESPRPIFAHVLCRMAALSWTDDRAGVWHVPFGSGRHAPIAAEDQARVIVGFWKTRTRIAAQVLSSLRTGLSSLMPRSPQVLSRVLGRQVQYKQVSIETMLTMMASGGGETTPGA